MHIISLLTPISISNSSKMRIGPHKDGGYVVYKPSLFNIDVLFNYGVGWDIAFEEDFHFLTQKKVFMYDPTMFENGLIDKQHCILLFKSFQWKRLYHYIMHMRKWGKKINDLKSINIFFNDEGIARVAQRKYNTLKNHFKQNNITNETILLKIDIEGNEYDILNTDDFYDCLTHVDQILIEFHDLKNKLREVELIIHSLKESFEIIHAHGCNFAEWFTIYRDDGDIKFPDVVEFTLVRKDSILADDIIDTKIDYPIDKLDYPCNPFREEYRLDF